MPVGCTELQYVTMFFIAFAGYGGTPMINYSISEFGSWAGLSISQKWVEERVMSAFMLPNNEASN